MLADGTNSTVGLVNSSGSLATQFTYEPFGRTTFSGSGTANLYRFAGRELDATGLYFMRARYYNPILQRFLSPDPLGFGGGSTDLYGYAFNSPTNFIDPLGFSAAGTAFGAIGGLYGCTGGGGGGGGGGGLPAPNYGSLQDYLSQGAAASAAAAEASDSSGGAGIEAFGGGFGGVLEITGSGCINCIKPPVVSVTPSAKPSPSQPPGPRPSPSPTPTPTFKPYLYRFLRWLAGTPNPTPEPPFPYYAPRGSLDPPSPPLAAES
jgi:RHS repeat-associated protein